ncbi:hypothetical protein DOFOFD_11645 [Acetobacteraceae bacterium EV16P]|uniref:Uncharacterized protein n=1 Tax=Sorlinia euscelidii TaxID=3081148 RepID=A0ABU7U5X1_9PROT
MKIVFRRDILKLGAGASVLNLTGLKKAFAKDPAATTRFDANTVREKARKLARSAMPRRPSPCRAKSIISISTSFVALSSDQSAPSGRKMISISMSNSFRADSSTARKSL